MSGTSFKFNLCCLIERDKEPFLVTASSNVLILELKRKIKAEKENALQRVDASDLVLWKVRCFLVICSDIMGPHYP